MPAAERHHVDAHHAAAHLVGRDELNQRRHGREDHHHQRGAGQEQQDLAHPQQADIANPRIKSP
jgi:hypothetical protein